MEAISRREMLRHPVTGSRFRRKGATLPFLFARTALWSFTSGAKRFLRRTFATRSPDLKNVKL